VLTQSEIRELIYNALTSDTELTSIISDRIFWLGSEPINNDFPRLTYFIYDTVAGYSFADGGLGRTSEEYGVQINVYTDPSDIANMDAIVERIKAIMTNLCFRNTSTPVEFLDTDINKVVRPTRWEYTNV